MKRNIENSWVNCGTSRIAPSMKGNVRKCKLRWNYFIVISINSRFSTSSFPEFRGVSCVCVCECGCEKKKCFFNNFYLKQKNIYSSYHPVTVCLFIVTIVPPHSPGSSQPLSWLFLPHNVVDLRLCISIKWRNIEKKNVFTFWKINMSEFGDWILYFSFYLIKFIEIFSLVFLGKRNTMWCTYICLYVRMYVG